MSIPWSSGIAAVSDTLNLWFIFIIHHGLHVATHSARNDARAWDIPFVSDSRWWSVSHRLPFKIHSHFHKLIMSIFPSFHSLSSFLRHLRLDQPLGMDLYTEGLDRLDWMEDWPGGLGMTVFRSFEWYGLISTRWRNSFSCSPMSE